MAEKKTPQKEANCLGGPGRKSGFMNEVRNVAFIPRGEHPEPATIRMIKSTNNPTATYRAHSSQWKPADKAAMIQTWTPVRRTTLLLTVFGNQKGGFMASERCLGSSVAVSKRSVPAVRCFWTKPTKCFCSSSPVRYRALVSSHPPIKVWRMMTKGNVEWLHKIVQWANSRREWFMNWAFSVQNLPVLGRQMSDVNGREEGEIKR